MSLEENKAIARRYNEEIWNKGNLTIIDEIVSDDFYEHGISGMRTPDGIRKAAATFHENNSDVRISVEDQIAEGDKVMNRLTGHAIDKATGKEWTVTIFFDVFRIVDGKIVEFWHAHDQLAVMKQLEA